MKSLTSNQYGGLLWFVLASLLAYKQSCGEEPAVIQVGAGSYLTNAPKLCKPLPEKIFRTNALNGPTPTNQWWSSLVWQKYSQNLFAHPIVVRCGEEGVRVVYPGRHIHGDKTGIFGSGDLGKGDLILGHSAVEKFPEANCDGFSDWFVTASLRQEQSSMKASFGHGSPYVFLKYDGGHPKVTFTKAPKIWSGDENSSTLGITVNGNHYGLFGPSGSKWSGLDGTSWRNQKNGANYFSTAVLPNDRPETLKLFQKHAHAHVTETRVEYSILEGRVHSTYVFQTEPREGPESETIFALYPHQWKYATFALSEMTYGSVRGTMKAGIGNRFTTAVPVQGLLPMLPREGLSQRSRVVESLKDEASKSKPGYGDSYWEGKHLGMLASLAGVAEVADAPEFREVFLNELKRRLEEWFTATKGKEQPVFYYNANWGSLIGSRPGYGSDTPLNDHHFHYGYFIRAAAEVARFDPEWAKKWGPMVNLIIRDIASGDRKDAMFPRLRCFDCYAGHSWASGDANFADGNNQESSSESLNAWYGMMLWGEATGDHATRDLGIALFNIERTAVEEYWFDVEGTNYPKDFPNVALGMIWGGKGAFGTWFSADIDCIHGINWLPFTPASLYMGRHPEYVQKNFDRIVSVRKGKDDFSTGWGDLVVMFGALHSPQMGVKYLDQNPRCKVESGNSKPFMDHWIHTLDRLGQVDRTVTASHPFQTVFIKNSERTYSAYNFGDKPITVSFSDGKRLDVPAKSLTTKSFPLEKK